MSTIIVVDHFPKPPLNVGGTDVDYCCWACEGWGIPLIQFSPRDTYGSEDEDLAYLCELCHGNYTGPISGANVIRTNYAINVLRRELKSFGEMGKLPI